MSAQHPTTIEEWAVYIGGLQDVQLWHTANTANSLEFIKILKGEGYTSGDITQIMLMFAEQFRVADVSPPKDMPGQYLSFSDLLESLEREERSHHE